MKDIYTIITYLQETRNERYNQYNDSEINILCFDDIDAAANHIVEVKLISDKRSFGKWDINVLINGLTEYSSFVDSEMLDNKFELLDKLSTAKYCIAAEEVKKLDDHLRRAKEIEERFKEKQRKAYDKEAEVTLLRLKEKYNVD